MLTRRPRAAISFLAVLLLFAMGLPYLTVSGAQSSERYLSIANPAASVTTQYRFGLDIVTAAPIGSMRIQFCSNNPVVETPCTAPEGFDVSNASLASQFGVVGYSIHPSTTSNVLVLSRTSFMVTPIKARYELDGVLNPSADGSYYARMETFTSDDATGSHIDFGSVAFSINRGVSITTTVPPFLLFCMGGTIAGVDCDTASGQYVQFGELATTETRTGSTQMVAATNGDGGYVISANGTTMLSGTNSIPALTISDVSRPGTSQFGINLRNNSDPDVGADPSGAGIGMPTANYGVANRYRFVPGEVVASISGPDDFRKYTVSYVVNIAKDQAPGVYVSTITYICNATF